MVVFVQAFETHIPEFGNTWRPKREASIEVAGKFEDQIQAKHIHCFFQVKESSLILQIKIISLKKESACDEIYLYEGQHRLNIFDIAYI